MEEALEQEKTTRRGRMKKEDVKAEELKRKKKEEKVMEEVFQKVIENWIGNDEEEEVKVEEKKWEHPPFTNIRGGICEFCGLPVLQCEFHQKAFREGTFRCLCGGSANFSTFSQSIYKYWDKHKVWVCNSEGCRKRVEMLGGYTDPEIMRFYL